MDEHAPTHDRTGGTRRGRRIALTLAVAGLLGPAALTAGPADAASPGFNGRIAFLTSTGPDDDTDIDAVEVDGSGRTSLTALEGVDERAVAWSPDGSRVAFSSYEDGDAELFVMDADGSNRTQVTHNTEQDTEPTWSPDGTQLAFRAMRNGFAEIHRIDVDGTDETPLTQTPSTSEFGPAWSPNSDRIAFIRHLGPDVFEVFAVDGDGTNEQQITFHGQESADPDWSPDGTRIVYARSDQVDVGLWVIQADGTGAEPLLDDPAVSESEPVWSPDGTRVAYIVHLPDRSAIWTVGADGSGAAPLVSVTGEYDGSPSWQPSSTPPPTTTTESPTTTEGSPTTAVTPPDPTPSGRGGPGTETGSPLAPPAAAQPVAARFTG